MRTKFGLLNLVSWLCVAILSGCAVRSVCYTDSDCPQNQICRNGDCVLECQKDEDCALDQVCQNNHCVFASGCVGCPYPDAPHGKAECRHGECVLISCDEGWLDQDGDPRNGCECYRTETGELLCEGETKCPDDMVDINGLFCIDKYEASRPDATATSMGSDTSRATSRAGVLPWLVNTVQEAAEACRAAGKRLCNPAEWQMACQGPDMTVYSYGDEYDPQICNGIDTYCMCDSGKPECHCQDGQPYPGCYWDCGARFHLMPTGSFPNCVNEYGLYDMNGNVWEAVQTSDGLDHYRGGAYNCGNSKKLHRCDYDATWGPSAKGFRCCK